MPSTKVEKSNLIVKNSDDELEKMPSKHSTLCRDVVILSVSFAFTIAVACFILFHNLNNHQQNAKQIEKIVEMILDGKVKHMMKEKSQAFERKHGNLNDKHEDTGRNKRAIHDFGVQTNEGPIVEFFNPKLRPEMEKNDTETMKKTGLKGAAPKGDSWVWLTSYSRIPFEAIEGFCKKTKEYCPPGPTGSPGSAGPKGVKGETGPEGPTGKSIRGAQGRLGPKGMKGDTGRAGLDGHDGRDGIPGEPGIDGIPGRAGTDGKDGIDGINGERGEKGKRGERGDTGEKGKDGINGTNGSAGAKGEMGLAGPLGRRGIPGKDGENGAPATCVYYMEKLNITAESEIWLPPHIPVSKPSLKNRKPIIVHEQDNLRLQCAATGNPIPKIVWRREDEKPITWGNWKDITRVGESLNITSINRVHMGTYVCIADNGIPPIATYKFQVEIHFKPIVRIHTKGEQTATADPDDPKSRVTFKCESEAFPEPVIYWERGDGLVIESKPHKYVIETHSTENYKFNTTLTILRIDNGDYGDYHCVSKNRLGIASVPYRLGTKGQFPLRIPDKDKPVVSGEIPELQSYDDVCPPPETCPECQTPKDLKCKDTSLSLKDLTGGKELEIGIAGNITYPAMPNRTQHCELTIVGKPVFYNHLEMDHGAWLRDPIQKDNITIEKIWLTKEAETTNLYEYKNRIDYQKNKPSRNQPYKLPCAFKGNAHIIYNANFYYYCAEGSKLVKYDLKSEKSIFLPLESVNSTQYLYTTNYNVIDFNADDNGLWIIHATPDSNHTIVSKINDTNLEFINSFNISVHHHKVGEMFIICGVLYAVDSTSAPSTKIRFALDLYTGKLLDKEIVFTNPFNATTTLGYNHNNKELYTWNRGNQLTYPVRINAMGTNATRDKSFEEVMKNIVVGHTVTRIKKIEP